MEFFDWNTLGSHAGAVCAVGVITQITKNLPLIRRIPTQLYSYLIALAVLSLALIFGPGANASELTLTLFNAALVSLSANGGHEALTRLAP